MKDELLSAEEVKQVRCSLVANCRHKLLAIPSRLSVELATAETAPACAKLLKKEIYSALTELSG